VTVLDIDDFDTFMEEVTGFPPFPWQSRLLRRVVDRGWPELLDLPTGTGKTSTLLIALFALALDPRDAPRRIALVVDRRIIVDQVDGFARTIEAALRDPQKPTAARVAARLCALNSEQGAPPVRVVHLRGGVPRDDSWIGAPDQPTIIASTVDQVGSRLLFRGYGVSPCMRPIHAGVLARDTLYLLDEVHLAAAFEETLAALQGYAGWAEEPNIGRGFRVVRMSATPPGGPTLDRFGLDDKDRAHSVLARRLCAPRPAELVLVKTTRGSNSEVRERNRTRVAKAAVERALEAAKPKTQTQTQTQTQTKTDHSAKPDAPKVIGIVLNRVDTARRVAASLHDSEKNATVLLITGRMRPFERTAVQAELSERAAAGSSRETVTDTTFVVATSCVEAGADLDFDALITEAASLDALRQRFGRLNRLGERSDARAWVLGSSDQVAAKASPDPIYGHALRETWAYLQEIATGEGETKRVDFGLTAFPEPDPDRRVRLLPERKQAPVMFPSYLDMWSETRPAPHPDPDPALWLKGKDAEPQRDLNLVFRRDIPAPPTDPEALARVESQVVEALEFLPPIADEVVAVPSWDLERWLDRWGKGTGEALVWRWSSDGVEAVRASALAPCDTVLIPAAWGGLGLRSWDPQARVTVDDVAERAAFRRDFERLGVAKLRLDAAVLPRALASGLPRPAGADDDPDTIQAARAAVHQWLDGLGDKLEGLPRAGSDDRRVEPDTDPEDTDSDSDSDDTGATRQTPEDLESWRPLLSTLARADGRREIRVGQSTSGRVWWVTCSPPKVAIVATTEDAVSSFTGIEVGLTAHLEDVEAWAGRFARSAGLSDSLVADLALAGRLHDLGKADPRFQALLRGGDPIHASGRGELAKSAHHGSAQSRARAARRANWPGLRHELISLALLDSSETLRARANDLELVRHLVASHHGWCRPWAPTTLDPTPTPVRATVEGVTAQTSTAALDDAFLNACASRFRRLCRRYGWHGLAYLEALLRLGDHRASRYPARRPWEQT